MARTVDDLEATIADCDEVLAEDDDSVDPVARRRVATALVTKAGALRDLGRHEDGADVWAQATLRFADDPPANMPFIAWHALFNQALAWLQAGRPDAAVETLDALIEGPASEIAKLRPLVARSLELKSRVLLDLQRVDAARAIDSEIVRRFQAASEPEVRVRVAFALTRQAAALLQAGRVSDCIEVSERLMRVFEAETDPEAVVAIADVALTHISALISTVPARPRTVATDVAVILMGASVEIVTSITRGMKVSNAPLRALRRLPGLTAVASAAAPGFAVERRLKARQAARASQALIDRLGGSPDTEHQRIAATARLGDAMARFRLGDLRAMPAALASLTATNEPGVVQAFSRLAENSRRRGASVGEAGALAFLFQRAQALGQGDRHIAKIAYEESLKAPGTTPRSRTGRVVGRILGG